MIILSLLSFINYFFTYEEFDPLWTHIRKIKVVLDASLFFRCLSCLSCPSFLYDLLFLSFSMFSYCSPFSCDSVSLVTFPLLLTFLFSCYSPFSSLVTHLSLLLLLTFLFSCYSLFLATHFLLSLKFARLFSFKYSSLFSYSLFSRHSSPISIFQILQTPYPLHIK
jgi:hypothetical protein